MKSFRTFNEIRFCSEFCHFYNYTEHAAKHEVVEKTSLSSEGIILIIRPLQKPANLKWVLLLSFYFLIIMKLLTKRSFLCKIFLLSLIIWSSQRFRALETLVVPPNLDKDLMCWKCFLETLRQTLHTPVICTGLILTYFIASKYKCIVNICFHGVSQFSLLILNEISPKNLTYKFLATQD